MSKRKLFVKRLPNKKVFKFNPLLCCKENIQIILNKITWSEEIKFEVASFLYDPYTTKLLFEDETINLSLLINGLIEYKMFVSHQRYFNYLIKRKPKWIIWYIYQYTKDLCEYFPLDISLILQFDHIDILKYLHTRITNNHFIRYEHYVTAVNYNSLKCLNYMMKHGDKNNRMIRGEHYGPFSKFEFKDVQCPCSQACYIGNLDALELTHDMCSSESYRAKRYNKDHRWCFLSALKAKNHNCEIIKFLLNNTTFKYDFGLVKKYYMYLQCEECLKLLAPEYDCSHEALLMAGFANSIKVIKVLTNKYKNINIIKPLYSESKTNTKLIEIYNVGNYEAFSLLYNFYKRLINVELVDTMINNDLIGGINHFYDQCKKFIDLKIVLNKKYDIIKNTSGISKQIDKESFKNLIKK